jgi:hypothetical protein
VVPYRAGRRGREDHRPTCSLSLGQEWPEWIGPCRKAGRGTVESLSNVPRRPQPSGQDPVRAEGARLHPLDGDVHAPQTLGRLAPLHVRRTLAISCEAVPASEMGRRGHEPAPPAGHGAGESFVSFIALFGGAAQSSYPVRLALPSQLRTRAPRSATRRCRLRLGLRSGHREARPN